MINILRKLALKSRMILSMVSPYYATKLFYKRAFGKSLNLNQPETLGEKILWLKLNTYKDNTLVTKCADKYKVREYIIEKGCEEILNELIGVYDKASEIVWTELPNKFVLKCNHGSGYNIICIDKKNLDIEKTANLLDKWMEEDFWKLNAEINYKYIKKKITCEKYLETKDGVLPEDYKIYCFNGEPKYVMLCLGRQQGRPKFYFFDREWNLMPYTKDALETPDIKIKKPIGIDEMFNYAAKLSEPFPFVRADFYLIEGKVIFGELTFTPAAGLDTNRLPQTDIEFGKLLSLPID